MVEFTKKIGVESFVEQFANSPASMAYLEAHFSNIDSATIDALLEFVDEGMYSLRDWIEALREMGHWLDAQHLEMELMEQIGYVSCAAAAAGAGANLSNLSSLVDDMLQTYGCERAVKKG